MAELSSRFGCIAAKSMPGRRRRSKASRRCSRGRRSGLRGWRGGRGATGVVVRKDRPTDGGADFSQKVWTMSPAARLSLVDRADPAFSIVAQCQLLKVARSTLYYTSGAGERRGSGGDAPDRRARHGDAVLRIAAHGGGAAPGGLAGEPQAGAAADAGDAAGGDLPEAEHQQGACGPRSFIRICCAVS